MLLLVGFSGFTQREVYSPKSPLATSATPETSDEVSVLTEMEVRSNGCDSYTQTCRRIGCSVLGSSGCGKTVRISEIVRLMPVNFGNKHKDAEDEE